MGAIKSRFRKVNHVSESFNYYSLPWGSNNANFSHPYENYCQSYNPIEPNSQQFYSHYPQEFTRAQQYPYYNQNGFSLGSDFFQNPNMSLDHYPVDLSQHNYASQMFPISAPLQYPVNILPEQYPVDLSQHNYGGQFQNASFPFQYNSADILPASGLLHFNSGLQEFDLSSQQFVPEYNFSSQTTYPAHHSMNFTTQTMYPTQYSTNLPHQTRIPTGQSYNPQSHGKSLTLQTAQHFNSKGNRTGNNTKIEYDSFTTLSHLSDGYGGVY